MFPRIEHGERGAVGHAEPLVEHVQHHLDGALGDVHGARDRLVGAAGDDVLDQLALALGQLHSTTS